VLELARATSRLADPIIVDVSKSGCRGVRDGQETTKSTWSSPRKTGTSPRTYDGSRMVGVARPREGRGALGEVGPTDFEQGKVA